MEEYLYERETEAIIKIFHKVYFKLGYGFLENVYQNALYFECLKQGVPIEAQVPIKVIYEGKVVGEYKADLVIDDSIIIEIKAVERLNDAHEAQLLNYLRATKMEIGLLLNFGPKAQIKRKIFTNDRKG